MKPVGVVNQILDQAVGVARPGPGLEADALALFRRMNIGRRIGRLCKQKAVIIPDAGDEQAAGTEAGNHAADRRGEVLGRQHMRQGVVHGDHDVKLFGKAGFQTAKIGPLKAETHAVLPGTLPGLEELGLADVRAGHVIAEGGQADGLGADAAGTVEDP